MELLNSNMMLNVVAYVPHYPLLMLPSRILNRLPGAELKVTLVLPLGLSLFLHCTVQRRDAGHIKPFASACSSLPLTVFLLFVALLKQYIIFI